MGGCRAGGHFGREARPGRREIIAECVKKVVVHPEGAVSPFKKWSIPDIDTYGLFGGAVKNGVFEDR